MTDIVHQVTEWNQYQREATGVANGWAVTLTLDYELMTGLWIVKCKADTAETDWKDETFDDKFDAEEYFDNLVARYNLSEDE